MCWFQERFSHNLRAFSPFQFSEEEAVSGRKAHSEAMIKKTRQEKKKLEQTLEVCEYVSSWGGRQLQGGAVQLFTW